MNTEINTENTVLQLIFPSEGQTNLTKTKQVLSLKKNCFSVHLKQKKT